MGAVPAQIADWQEQGTGGDWWILFPSPVMNIQAKGLHAILLSCHHPSWQVEEP